jgi:hypothetical protein
MENTRGVVGLEGLFIPKIYKGKKKNDLKEWGSRVA